MNLIRIGAFLFCSLITTTGYSQNSATIYKLINNKKGKRVEVFANGKPFTAYIYPESLKKPTLYPIRTARGSLITRGWPLDPRPNERTDHPHHVGLWFNYGDVNGYDFWNNSDSIPADKKNGYGTIRHKRINRIIQGGDSAILEVSMSWLDPYGDELLRQDTRYVFRGNGNERIIDLTIKLTAQKKEVLFKDNKEGVLGMRVARDLEHPSNIPEKYTDANGNMTAVARLNNIGVTGNYISSTGIQGDSVWGTRAEWLKLTGKILTEKVAITIIDHPGNIGYPTYWHARGYGLFAANPLGQKALSKGKETLNFKLLPGESTTFKYIVNILSE